MKRFLLSLMMALAANVPGEEVLERLDWGSPEGVTRGGEILHEEGGTVLKLVNPESTPREFPIWQLRSPDIESSRYGVLGQVRYEEVQGEAYLETMNHFAAEPGGRGGGSGQYFSRTLSPSGPMQKLEGSSEWREFAVPFLIHRSKARPEQIDFKLFLPGRGTVYLRDVRLVQFDENAAAFLGLGSTAWWSDRTGGWLAGITGAVFGCLASVFALLASKGKARKLVLACTWGMIAIGTISGAAGAVALARHQPYGVWFPLLLMGLLLLLILPFRLKELRRMYEDLELRRMRSVDT